jgi:hypothetical protein
LPLRESITSYAAELSSSILLLSASLRTIIAKMGASAPSKSSKPFKKEAAVF